MYPIVRKEKLADNIILMDIKAPRVAKECLPGQFIIAKTDEVVLLQVFWLLDLVVIWGVKLVRIFLLIYLKN